MGGGAAGLYGREDERATVGALLAAVGGGAKRALVFVGEPGIGKTALLHDAREHAVAAGFLTAAVRAPAFAGTPHAPVLPLLEGIRASCARARLDAPTVLHTVIATMSGAGTADADALRPLVAEAFDKIAARKPIGLFVDDFHRAPPAGADFLLEVMRALEAPGALVLTAPTDAAVPMPSADLWIDRCDVRGLTMDAAAELARARLGRPLLPSLLAALTRVTLTNPLYLQEALREWVESGALTEVGGFVGSARDSSLHASRSLGALIAARISSTDDRSLDVARTLAILARDVAFDELLAMSTGDADDLVEWIERGVHAGIVVEDPGPPVTYRVAHPMYERALVDAMSPTVAGLLHQRVFEGLRARKTAGYPVLAAQIATHAIDALEQPEDLDELIRAAAREAESVRSLQDAATWWQRAAERARDARARAEALRGQAAATVESDAKRAVGLYTAALEITQGSAQRDLLLGRALANRIAGSLREALDDLERALPGAEPDVAAGIRTEIAFVAAAAGRLEDAEGMLEDLAAFPGLEGRTRVRVMANLGCVRYARGDPIAGKELMEQAAAEAEQGAALHIEGNVMWFSFVLGDWDAARRMATTLIARADREGDLWHLTLPLTVGAMIDAARGATAVAIDLARRAVRVAERLGCPADVFDALESMVIVLLETEKPGEAVGLARRIGALFREGIESRPDQARPFVAAGEAFLEAGDTVGARAMAEQARALVHDCVWGVSVDRLESEIRLRLRDREGALRRIGRWLDEPSPVVFEQARVHEVAARALFLLGERDAGARQADEAIGFYRRIGVRPRLERFERIVRKYRPRKPGRPRSELPGGLTPRELEVLRLVLQGLTNRQIADVLTVSALTVKKHVENLLAKAKVRRRAELLEFATRAGVTFEPFVAPKQA